jgi:hypothetical protein
MTIYNRKNGSINCFYKGKMINSVGTDDFYSIDYYKYAANRLLIEGMTEGYKMNDLKHQFLNSIKRFRYKGIKKEDETIDNRETILCIFLILCKLKVIDEDGNTEGLLICGRKKSKQATENPRHQP